MFFLSSGCSEKKAADTSQKTVKIAAAFYPQYIMCLNITQNISDVELTLSVPSGTFPLSDYQLSRKDLAEIYACDIFVINGAGMENFPAQVLTLKKSRLIAAAGNYPLINNNPYVWLSPAGACYEVQRIADGLSNLDSLHASQYRTNAEIYEKKLTSLSNEMRKALAVYKGTSIVTLYEPVRYLSDEFGLNILSAIKYWPETEADKKGLTEFVRQIKSAQKNSRHICLYAEQQFPVSVGKLIETKTGLIVHKIDPCISGPLVPDAYIDAQEKNLFIFVQSLSGCYDDGDN